MTLQTSRTSRALAASLTVVRHPVLALMLLSLIAWHAQAATQGPAPQAAEAAAARQSRRLLPCRTCRRRTASSRLTRAWCGP